MNIISTASRKSFIRHGKHSLALPFMLSLLPKELRAAAEKSSAKKPTPRLLWMSMGHGHMEKHFYPEQVGHFKDIGLPPALKPLSKHLDSFTMISNLSNNQNKQPHEGTEALLTCCNVIGFPGKARHNSVSCDQIASLHLGQSTRYKSLQLNCTKDDAGNGHGAKAMSYREDGSPLPGITQPLELYQKLFGAKMSKEEQLNLIKKRRSVLDIMKTESSSSKAQLSREDRDKLEEYTTSLRDIELNLQREAEWADIPYPKSNIKLPRGVLEGEKAISMMFKLIIAAYQTDSTRIITYRMPDAGLVRSMGISSTPHTLSHYGSNVPRHALNLKRSTKWMELYAELITALKNAKDPLCPNGSSLFDNSLVFNGGGLRTAHRNTNTPCLLTGGGFKGLVHGQHRLAEKENTPLANLWTTMLQDAGAPVTRFADSDGLATKIWS